METRKSRYRAYRAQIEAMPEEEFPKGEDSQVEIKSPYEHLETALQAEPLTTPNSPYDEYVRRHNLVLFGKVAVFLLLLGALLVWYFLRIR